MLKIYNEFRWQSKPSHSLQILRPESSPTSIHSFTLAVILPTLYWQQYADLSPLFVLVKLMLMLRVHLSIWLIRYAVKIIKYRIKTSGRTQSWDRQNLLEICKMSYWRKYLVSKYIWINGLLLEEEIHYASSNFLNVPLNLHKMVFSWESRLWNSGAKGWS